MEKILYKAKTAMDNEWVFGYPFKDQGKWYIIPLGKKFKDRVVVVEKTISQYTNLNDKNGEMIFENDKIKTIYETEDGPIEVVCEVDYCNGEFGVRPIYEDNIFSKRISRCYENIEVVGNIYGN